MSFFSSKSKLQKSMSEDVLNSYTTAVSVWLDAASKGESGDHHTIDMLSIAGKPPVIRSDLIDNEVSRDLCIMTARKWVGSEIAKRARRDGTGGNAATSWSRIESCIIDALPPTTTL